MEYPLLLPLNKWYQSLHLQNISTGGIPIWYLKWFIEREYQSLFLFFITNCSLLYWGKRFLILPAKLVTTSDADVQMLDREPMRFKVPSRRGFSWASLRIRRDGPCARPSSPRWDAPVRSQTSFLPWRWGEYYEVNAVALGEVDEDENFKLSGRIRVWSPLLFHSIIFHRKCCQLRAVFNKMWKRRLFYAFYIKIEQ